MNYDIAMPTAFFIIVLAATLLSSRVKGKVQSAIEGRQFKTRDIALLVTLIAVSVSVIVFIPTMAIMAVFLFSYSSLLFTISYTFSDLRSKKLVLYCTGFITASILAAVTGFFILPPNLQLLGVLAFAGLATCALFALIYAQKKTDANPKWYLAALSPVLFLILFLLYNDTAIWSPYLLDVYGVIFAVCIVIYLAPMFNWKTLFTFAVLLTVLDIILVWGTGTMVQAATSLMKLNLPVMISLPTLPPTYTVEGALAFHSLGLGDLFFAGILSTQTLKKFGKKTMLISLLTTTISLGSFMLILSNPELAAILPVAALPATMPIIIGWLPAVAVKLFLDRKNKQQLVD